MGLTKVGLHSTTQQPIVKPATIAVAAHGLALFPDFPPLQAPLQHSFIVQKRSALGLLSLASYSDAFCA